MTDLARLSRAAELATRAHAGQMRKGLDLPYVTHPATVARLVAEAGGGELAVTAAWLHDVVEDCGVSLGEIGATFGPKVAAIVADVTDRDDWAALPMAERKARQAAHAATMGRDAQLVKMADQTSNLADMALARDAFPGAKAATYLAGARAVVDNCRAASPDLAARFDAAATRLETLLAQEENA